MPRTVLVHLNVEVPDGDERSVEEIESAVRGALEVGSDHELVKSLGIEITLSEEI